MDDPGLDAEVIAVADEGFRRSGCTATGWRSPRSATRRLPAGLRRAAARVPRRARPWTRRPGARAGQPVAGARRQAPRGARPARRRAAAGRPPVARGGRAPRRGEAAPRRPGRRLRGEPADGARASTTTRRRPSSSSTTAWGPVRPRRRRALRRADGAARRAAALRGRYGIGVDRTLLACRVEGVQPWSTARWATCSGCPLGDTARRRLMVLAAALRRTGVRVDLATAGAGSRVR